MTDKTDSGLKCAGCGNAFPTHPTGDWTCSCGVGSLTLGKSTAIRKDSGWVERLDDMAPADMGRWPWRERFVEMKRQHTETVARFIEHAEQHALVRYQKNIRIEALEAQVERLTEENAELKQSVIAFGAPWAVSYAKDFGLAEGELHPTHYDILEAAGGRMDSFTRAALAQADAPKQDNRHE